MSPKKKRKNDNMKNFHQQGEKEMQNELRIFSTLKIEFA